MKDYKSYAVIIVVTEIEEDAVRRMFDWKDLTFDDDEQVYYEINYRSKHIIYAKQDEVGMTASATLATKVIERFKPKYLIMPGIAAGTYEEGRFQEMYGDIIIANMVWNHSNGKIVSRDITDPLYGKLSFLTRPSVVNVDKDLIEKIEKVVYSRDNENFVHIGPIASGYAVIADKDVVENKIISQFDDTVGIEMEGYGIAYAALHSTLPKPKALIAKGICDFADSSKTNKYQKFAAYTSCEFVKYLIDNVLD